MAKMGRPKKSIVKDKRITIRLDATEYNKLVEYAHEHCLTVTETITKGIDFLYENSNNE